jgi:hypothetical protein
MKTIFIFLLLSVSVIGFSGEKSFEIDNFTSLVAQGNFKVILIKSTENKVVAVNDDANVTDDKISVEVEGTELVLKINNDSYKSREIVFTVYYTDLFNINAKRGAWVKSNDIFTHSNIQIEVDTGSRITLKTDCNTINAKISNGGTIELSGKAINSNLTVSKGGNLKAFDLLSENSKAKVTFGGEIIVNATNTLFAVVKSGGTIKYKGEPKELTEEIKLGGKIIKG